MSTTDTTADAVDAPDRPRPGSGAAAGIGPVDPTVRASGRRGRRPWAAVAATGAATALAVGYVFAVDPNNPTNAYPQCFTKRFIGLDCPLCGGLRGTHDLLHGDIGQALHHNALLVVVLPLLAYLLVWWGAQQFGRELPAVPHPRWLLVLGTVLVVAFTVVRNIPGTPLYWLNSAAV